MRQWLIGESTRFEWFEHSNRPITDKGYAEFTRRLLNRIGGGTRRHMTASIVSVLRKRELGNIAQNRFTRISFLSLMKGCVISLASATRMSSAGPFVLWTDRSHYTAQPKKRRITLLKRSRTYCFTESHMMKGKVIIEKNLMVKNNEREVYDLERHKRLCTITALRHGELIQSCIYVDCVSAATGRTSGHTPNWLILLTRAGRVLFVNIRDGTTEAMFILPAEEFRYRRMCWCDAWQSFAVFGETKKSMSAASNRHVVALFRASPIAYSGLFALDKKDFGYANEVGTFSEFLVLFGMRPRRLTGYSINQFSTQRSTVSIDGEDAPCEEILIDSPTTHRQVPQACFAFDGSWDSIETGISGTIYMLHPSTKRDSFVIGDWKNRPIQVPFELKETANTAIQTNGEHIILHGDGSGRVLCVEGPFIICYYLRRTADNQLAYVEQWRRKLWVDESFYERFSQDEVVRSSSGRRIKLTPSTFTTDDRLTLVEVHFDLDSGLVYVVCTCDMNSAVFDDPDCPSTEMNRRNRSEDRGGVVFILDGDTGDIFNVIMQRAEALEALRIKFTTTGITATIGMKYSEIMHVEVQQLKEMGVRQWRDGNHTRKVPSTSFGRRKRKRPARDM